MALIENINKKSLVLKLKTGKTEGGNDIFSNQRLSGVKSSAPLADVFEVSEAIKNALKFEAVEVGLETSSAIIRDFV